MNQVMITAVEWQLLVEENKRLKEKVGQLEETIDHQQERIRLLIAEVAFVEGGYKSKMS